MAEDWFALLCTISGGPCSRTFDGAIKATTFSMQPEDGSNQKYHPAIMAQLDSA
jgi:hypothetical protein